MTALGHKIASGAFWTVGMRLSIRLIGIVSVIVLARILVPEDFGIVAKASMIASFLELITFFGLENALIQNQSATAKHYDTVWTIEVIRSAGIAVVLVVVSSPASEFFREPVLADIILFYALATLIRGFINVGVVDFRKKLRFERDFRFNVCRKVGGFVATIFVAVIWRSYWAFVAGVMTASFVALVASYKMSEYRPSLSLARWRSLFNYSKWVFLSGIVSSVSLKLDLFILSRYSTTEALGEYTVAIEIAGAPSTEVAMPIARATMPGLAALSDDKDMFRTTYTATLLVLLFIAVPVGVGVSVVAEPITAVLLGEKWADAAPIIKILAFFGIARAMYSVSASAFFASGHVDYYAGLNILNLVLRVLFLIGGYYFGGVIGLAWGVLHASVIQVFIIIATQHYLAHLHLRDFLSQIWRVLVAAAIMYISVSYALPMVDVFAGKHQVTGLALGVLFGAVVYGVSLSILWLISSNRRGPEVIVLDFLKLKLGREGSPI